MKTWVRVKVNWSRYGYGYSFGSSWLGVVVLVFHGVVAGVYVCWVLWVVGWKGEGVARGWEGILEFVMLGLGNGDSGNGRERLVNTCAGVQTTGVWRERIAVRECEGGLEIVVGQEEIEKSRERRVRCGVEYGAI